MSVDPYNALPISCRKLRLLFHIRMGLHLSPVEQGWLARPGVPRHSRSYILCLKGAWGDEQHCVLDCPYFVGLRLVLAKLFDVAHSAMRTLMWHKDQKAVSALISGICAKAWTLWIESIRPHRPLLANWT